MMRWMFVIRILWMRIMLARVIEKETDENQFVFDDFWGYGMNSMKLV